MSTGKTIVLEDYKKYWISDTAQGHLIKICYGKNDQVLEIDVVGKTENEQQEIELSMIKNKYHRPIEENLKYTL